MGKIKGWELVSRNKYTTQWASGTSRLGSHIKVQRQENVLGWEIIEWQGNTGFPNSGSGKRRINTTRTRMMAERIAISYMRSHLNG